MSLVVTCTQCREEVLNADRIGDEEECVLCDHLFAVHVDLGARAKGPGA